MSIKFENDFLIYDGKKIAPSIRTFSQMRPVLAFPERECPLTPRTPTYFMYREAEKFEKIRYDITRIPSLDLCGEKNKTLGHCHPKSQKEASWAEIYEVLEGVAHFVLQRVTQLGVEDAVLLSAKKGEKLLIPPNYGHVSINTGKKDLILGNLVSSSFESDYSPYIQNHGACVYETKEGKLIKNKSYGTFELRKLSAVKFSSSFGCFSPFKKLSLLAAAVDYKNIEFLEKPELFY